MTTQLYNIKPFDYHSNAYGYKFHNLEDIVAEINDSKDCTVHNPGRATLVIFHSRVPLMQPAPRGFWGWKISHEHS